MHGRQAEDAATARAHSGDSADSLEVTSVGSFALGLLSRWLSAVSSCTFVFTSNLGMTTCAAGASAPSGTFTQVLTSEPLHVKT